MGSPYLEHIKITAFGAFTNKVVGPFSRHLNVVFGRNEAGKTTLASFVGGVLFGWEDARGNRNTYKPDTGERAGSLFFAVPQDEGAAEGLDESDSQSALASLEGPNNADEIELSRKRNADGLQGDASIVADLDKETFNTMFSLNSDELRSLRNTTDMTAKLLTAGSGTGASPAHALAEIDSQLATYTSRAAGAEQSLVRLADEKDELREQIVQASEEEARYKRENQEFHDLAPQRDEMMDRLDTLNSEIEDLTARQAHLEKLDNELEGLRNDIADLEEEESELARAHEAIDDSDLEPLMELSSADERALRDRIDTLASDEAKREHEVDLARTNYTSSKAAYEAFTESEDEAAAERRSRQQRRLQITLSIVLPVVILTIGVFIVLYGRSAESLSLSVLGVVIVICALIVAFAAIVMLFRPNKEVEAQEKRKEDARWVMLQDEKKLEACLQHQSECAQNIQDQLATMGLAAAQGSPRQARLLLDEARDARSDENLYLQKQQAFVSRRSALEENLEAAEHARAELFEGIGSHAPRSAEAIQSPLEQKSEQRAGLLEASESLNRRYGELKQELSQAEHLHNFDNLKFRYAQLTTREEESAHEYTRLLLARRMLAAAIGAWESKSQPEVYRQASRLLSLMTDGTWTKVFMNSEGRLQVMDAVKTTRDPAHLSMGTCQQLYLALRIALLMAADNVGRAVPILADDILVNFDSARRRGAARALAELARVRQVILFTCHEEIVEAMRAVDPELNEVEL